MLVLSTYFRRRCADPLPDALPWLSLVLSNLKINGVDLRQPCFILVVTSAAPKAFGLTSHAINETVSDTVRAKETSPRVLSKFSFPVSRISITGLETEKWHAFYVWRNQRYISTSTVQRGRSCIVSAYNTADSYGSAYLPNAPLATPSLLFLYLLPTTHCASFV
jgi:hypothetical protein